MIDWRGVVAVLPVAAVVVQGSQLVCANEAAQQPLPAVPAGAPPCFAQALIEALRGGAAPRRLRALTVADRRLELKCAPLDEATDCWLCVARREWNRAPIETRDLFAALDQLPVELHVRDARSGRFLYANRAELGGSTLPGEEIAGRQLEDVYPPDQASFVSFADRELMAAADRSQHYERSVGERRFRAGLRLVQPPWRDGALIVRVAEDVTALSNAQAERERLMADLSRAESVARVGNCRLDLQTQRLYLSHFLRGLLEIDDVCEYLSFEDLLARFEPEAARRLAAMRHNLLDGQPVSCEEISYRNSRGDTVELEVRAELLLDQNARVEAVYATFLDVTTRVFAERQVRFLAYHDVLTELPNRAYFMDRAGQLLARARHRGEPFALHLIDLDGFKPINDVHGHLAGDQVLQVVARRIRSAIKKSDVVARLGGDEFAVLHRNIGSEAEVRSLGQRLVAKLGEPISLGTCEVRVGASLGAAIYADDASVQIMMHRADEVLYEVKRGGKGNFRLAM